jgi:NAD(P)H-hydrate epimerase
MIPVLTAAEMQDADRRTIQDIGVPGVVLMENAGAAVARVVRSRFAPTSGVVVLCGKGNNGGDGFVLARHLLDLGPEVFLLGARSEVKGDAQTHLEALERSGGVVREVLDLPAWQAVRQQLSAARLVVDALLGTGLQRAPAGLMGQAVRDLAGLSCPIVAVDLPSGVPSDTGDLAWDAVSAALTVTFAAAKHGHVLPPACDRVGELAVADIGIPRALLASTRLWLLEAADAAAAFPTRRPGSHKGDYGHLLLVAGSLGKSGAAILAAAAAARAGAGLVTVATPAPALPIVAAGRPEIMTEPLPVDASGAMGGPAVERALALVDGRDAVVLGPGLGQQGATRDLVWALVEGCRVPLLVDADGLNLLAPTTGRESGLAALRNRQAATVLTPHPGEMARLLGTTVADVQGGRLEAARRLARETGAVVVLKGHRSLVARPDGLAAVNPTGNPGMATGGVGDVLSGIVGALLARGHDAWLSATAGVFVHGAAGDRAAARLGQESLLAGDLVESLSDAIRALGADHP